MSTTMIRVPFHNGHIEATHDIATGIWVSVKRVCEHLGLNYPGQFTRLKKAAWAVVEMIQTTGPDGKNYEMFCIRADCIAKWMSEINPNKVRDDIREMIEAYQVEARDVLSAWFTPDATEAVGGVSFRQLYERFEEDRKYWLKRDTVMVAMLNKHGEKLLELEDAMKRFRTVEPIGRVEARRILDRLMNMARMMVFFEEGMSEATEDERHKRTLQIRRMEEDRLRRTIGFPRDTGNHFYMMPSDKMGAVRIHLTTMEEEAKKDAARKQRAKAARDQGDLFGSN